MHVQITYLLGSFMDVQITYLLGLIFFQKQRSQTAFPYFDNCFSYHVSQYRLLLVFTHKPTLVRDGPGDAAAMTNHLAVGEHQNRKSTKRRL